METVGREDRPGPGDPSFSPKRGVTSRKRPPRLDFSPPSPLRTGSAGRGRRGSFGLQGFDAGPEPGREERLKIRFWGTRGSIPTPGPSTLRYGGNTSCVEIRTAGGTNLVLDCGTGARMLGEELARDFPKGLEASFLFGHTHWDHIQGFPFFRPLFMKGNRFRVYAPGGADKRLADILAGQMEYAYFPVRLDQLQAQLEFRELGEDTFTIREVQVTTQYLNHTAVTLGYRLSAGDVTVVYATDHEPHVRELRRSNAETLGAVLHPGDGRHIRFLEGADLVIHDAQYCDEEYGDKVGWGHSTVEYATDVAAAAGVRRLALFHHDPSHDDTFLDRLVERCQARAKERGSNLELIAAREGDLLEIPENRRITPPLPAAIHPVRPASARILIVDNEAPARELIGATLEDEGYELVIATSGREALERAFETPPDLLLLDVAMPGMDGGTVCRTLRADPRTRSIPIVMLTASASESDIAAGFEWGATDYMTKPFAPSQLRARVRSWLLRSTGARRN